MKTYLWLLKFLAWKRLDFEDYQKGCIRVGHTSNKIERKIAGVCLYTECSQDSPLIDRSPWLWWSQRTARWRSPQERSPKYNPHGDGQLHNNLTNLHLFSFELRHCDGGRSCSEVTPVGPSQLLYRRLQAGQRAARNLAVMQVCLLLSDSQPSNCPHTSSQTIRRELSFLDFQCGGGVE